MPIALAASMPPMTAVPMIWRATEPAPDAVHSGTQPRMKANEVIRIGPQAKPCPFERRIHQRLALLVSFLGELDDQNRVLGGQADQHHQADLRINIVLDLHHVSRAESAAAATRRSHNTPKAPNTATGVLRSTLNGSDQLS